MKRKEYIVSYEIDGKPLSFIKFAWNSANKEIEHIVKGQAEIDKLDFHLTLSETKKLGCDCVSGYREWQSNSRQILFIIEKLA